MILFPVCGQTVYIYLFIFTSPFTPDPRCLQHSNAHHCWPEHGSCLIRAHRALFTHDVRSWFLVTCALAFALFSCHSFVVLCTTCSSENKIRDMLCWIYFSCCCWHVIVALRQLVCRVVCSVVLGRVSCLAVRHHFAVGRVADRWRLVNHRVERRVQRAPGIEAKRKSVSVETASEKRQFFFFILCN